MLIIRLQRVGKRNSPAYRIVLIDSRRAPQSGSFLEILGSYNPQHKESFMIKKERVSHWLSKGVQASDTMHNLLIREKIIEGQKRNVVAISTLKKAKEKEKLDKINNTPEEQEKKPPATVDPENNVSKEEMVLKENVTT